MTPSDSAPDPLPDGIDTAVVDSIEDGLATVFFERDGEEVASRVLDAAVLPEDARHSDAILAVAVEDGDVEEWTYDPDQTVERKQQAQDRFDRLSRRPPTDEENE